MRTLLCKSQFKLSSRHPNLQTCSHCLRCRHVPCLSSPSTVGQINAGSKPILGKASKVSKEGHCVLTQTARSFQPSMLKAVWRQSSVPHTWRQEWWMLYTQNAVILAAQPSRSSTSRVLHEVCTAAHTSSWAWWMCSAGYVRRMDVA